MMPSRCGTPFGGAGLCGEGGHIWTKAYSHAPVNGTSCERALCPSCSVISRVL